VFEREREREREREGERGREREEAVRACHIEERECVGHLNAVALIVTMLSVVEGILGKEDDGSA
jgi:hypothetical protein